jgi:hypothetical protein
MPVSSMGGGLYYTTWTSKDGFFQNIFNRYSLICIFESQIPRLALTALGVLLILISQLLVSGGLFFFRNLCNTQSARSDPKEVVLLELIDLVEECMEAVLHTS